MKHRLQLFFSFVISWLVVTSSSPSAYSWNNRSVKEHLTVFIHKIPNRIWPYFFQLEYNRTGVKFRFVVTTSVFAQLWRCGLVLPSVEQLVSALQTRFLLMQKRRFKKFCLRYEPKLSTKHLLLKSPWMIAVIFISYIFCPFTQLITKLSTF